VIDKGSMGIFDPITAKCRGISGIEGIFSNAFDVQNIGNVLT
jgi:hypothetical protein